jgi:hypothetical protein
MPSTASCPNSVQSLAAATAFRPDVARQRQPAMFAAWPAAVSTLAKIAIPGQNSHSKGRPLAAARTADEGAAKCANLLRNRYRSRITRTWQQSKNAAAISETPPKE